MTELWHLPVPASALLKSPEFFPLPRRQCEIRLFFEDDYGGERCVNLRFDGVEAYRCTYLGSCTPEMFNLAYGKLVSLENTLWLGEIRCAGGKDAEKANALHHMMITFDDGPCYEVVCSSVRID
jgi:hypothetical protein